MICHFVNIRKARNSNPRTRFHVKQNQRRRLVGNFEPAHAFPRLTPFQGVPLSHLGNFPYKNFQLKIFITLFDITSFQSVNVIVPNYSSISCVFSASSENLLTKASSSKSFSSPVYFSSLISSRLAYISI